MSDTSGERYDPPMDPLRDESNFYVWKRMITVHLDFLNLLEIVIGTTPRPETPPSSTAKRTPSQRTWDIASAQAAIFIYHRLDPSIQASIVIPSTAPEVWESLMQQFHRREPTVLMRGLSAITGLRLKDGESIKEHLKAFEHAWFELSMRTEDAPAVVEGAENSLETVLRTLTRSQFCKAEMMITSLSSDMWEVGWDLRDRYGAELRAGHVSGRLMELHELRESRRRRDEAVAAAAGVGDCTWCRSRGYESAGHGWRQCRRLEKFQKEKKEKARGSRG